ncbi:LytR/AlgR family response regulator transcription factor [Moheibacter sediminis]|uniref:Two component transcriptional regulator, LytTR family n=1 Tax=Moheibacter sediminis TaxID=1434700 RepID=A0A1W2AZV5_9FLAO|nr:LytTR family DNA-binding domain-containing protein [Moheibacter sediminis]SMC66216.1 two component transcriptional regulator, LytTR family [Moheibacter sediminis]
MILNCITIDDEPPALMLLENYINQTPFLKLKWSFTNAMDALKFIHENPVDLVFLDIQMADITGIELARMIANRPDKKTIQVIFTTAFEQYALEGYKLDVLDYLLKPFVYEDFHRAANKALKQIKILNDGLNNSSAKAEEESFIYLNIQHQKVKVNTKDILHIEGFKDYAKVFVKNADKPLMSIITLKSLEEQLPEGKFMRVHKSFIISLDKISAVGKSTVKIGDTLIDVSKPYADDFNEFLKNW